MFFILTIPLEWAESPFDGLNPFRSTGSLAVSWISIHGHLTTLPLGIYKKISLPRNFFTGPGDWLGRVVAVFRLVTIALFLSRGMSYIQSSRELEKNEISLLRAHAWHALSGRGTNESFSFAFYLLEMITFLSFIFKKGRATQTIPPASNSHAASRRPSGGGGGWRHARNAKIEFSTARLTALPSVVRITPLL